MDHRPLVELWNQAIPTTDYRSSLPIQGSVVDCDVEMQSHRENLPIDPEDDLDRQFWERESQKHDWDHASRQASAARNLPSQAELSVTERDWLKVLLEEEVVPASSDISSLPGTTTLPMPVPYLEHSPAWPIAPINLSWEPAVPLICKVSSKHDCQ